MNSEAVSSIASAFQTLGITGVSIGLAGMIGFLIWRQLVEDKRREDVDKAIDAASEATTTALHALGVQSSSTTDLVKSLHHKMDGATQTQTHIVNKLDIVSNSLAEMKGRASQ